jgi:molybdate transport system ATP-binding protein
MNGDSQALAARFRVSRGSFELRAHFEAPAQGVTALFGPSGSGKTTLLRAMAGLDRPREGFLSVAGEVWQDSASGLFLPPHRRPLGYVFQEAQLFDHLTVAGNLDYGRSRSRRREPRVRLAEAVSWLGVEPLLGRKPASLSGGERQRVAIARALATSPRLLLLDEPLSALDEASRGEILPYLERLIRHLAVPMVYVSHSLSEILRLADHVVLLAAGEVTAQGPVAEVATGHLGQDPETTEELGAVAEATVARTDPEEGLAFVEITGSPGAPPVILRLPRPDLAVGAQRRLRISARDVSLALERPRASSILNILPGRVVAVRRPDSLQPLVEVDCEGLLLVARITRKSLEDLGIQPGLELYAQLKAVALMP